jgi:hypothetical protein
VRASFYKYNHSSVKPVISTHCCTFCRDLPAHSHTKHETKIVVLGMHVRRPPLTPTVHAPQVEASSDPFLQAFARRLKGSAWGVLPGVLEDAVSEVCSNLMPAALRASKNFDDGGEGVKDLQALIHVGQVSKWLRV